MHYPVGCGLGCCVEILSESVGGREAAELSRAGLAVAQALYRGVCTGPQELRCRPSHSALGNLV